MRDWLLTSATSIHSFLAGRGQPERAARLTEIVTSTNVSDCAPWRAPADSRRDVEQAVCRWLSCLGWTGPRYPASSESSPQEGWLFFRANDSTLSVLVTSKKGSLDVRCGSPRALEDAPQTLAERELLARGEHLGLLTNGRELRILICDETCRWHAVVATCAKPDRHLLPLALDTHELVASLCAPQAVKQATLFVEALHRHHTERLDSLHQSILRGVSWFLSELLANGERPSWHAERSQESVAVALWREGLLAAFAFLLAARAEFLQASTTGMLLPLLTAASGPSESTSPPFAARLRATLYHLAARGALAETSYFVGEPTSVDPFPHLSELTWPDAPCRMFLRTLLLESTGQEPTRRDATTTRRNLEALSVSDLTHLFESFLEYTPAFAHVPLVKYRRGKREMVGPASLSPRKPVETIAAGQFYVTSTRSRKATGAFYTPLALVRALTHQSLAPKLAGLGPSDWGGVLHLSVLDPAMGTGAFLQEAAAQLGRALFDRALNCAREARPSATNDSCDCAASNTSTSLPPRLSNALTRWLDAAETNGTSEPDSPPPFPVDALAECITLCTERCLFGVDRNGVSAQIARIALGSSCDFDARVTRALEGHLITGNALTGPRLFELFSHPVTREPLEAPLRRLLDAHCAAYFAAAGSRDAHATEHSRAPVTDQSLVRYVATWSSALHATSRDDDQTSRHLLEQFSEIAAPAKRDDYAKERSAPDATSGLCFEFAFPSQFQYQEEHTQGGFDVILGNPPWDSVRHNTREVLSGFDLRAISISTKPERDALAQELREQGVLKNALDAQVADFERLKRIHDRLFCHQKLVIDGDLAGRQLDLFRLFLERAWGLLAPTGVLGMVVPSAFHTAAGAVGVRRLIFGNSRRVTYAVLRNARRWFDISPGLEFGLLAAERGQAEDGVLDFRFGLEGPELLLCDCPAWLSLPLAHILGQNPYATVGAFESREELELVVATQQTQASLSDFMRGSRVELRSTPTSVHRTHEAKHFVDCRDANDPRRSIPSVTSLMQRGAVLHEGATFARYDDTWGPPPAYALASTRVMQVDRWRRSIGYYRLVVRAIVGASAHKSIAAIVAPGTLAANSALIEATPALRPNYQALVALTVLNSSVASYLLSKSADLNVNLFALRRLPWPKQLPEAFLAHSALRLITNHAGFLPLFEEQLGSHSHVPTEAELPVVASLDARARLAGVLDAVVAKAYGLTRPQYRLVLEHFGEDATYRFALGAFDELEDVGETTFFERHDPCRAVPLVDSLPQSLLALDDPIT